MSSTDIALARVLGLLNESRLGEAKRLCDRTVRKNPQNADLVLGLVRVTYEAGAHDITCALCDRLLARQPDKAPALLYRGLALMALGKAVEALATFERGLAHHPNAWEFLVNRGIAFERLDRLGDAIASYEQAALIRPDCVEALNNLGNALQRQERNAEALTSYTQAVTHNPGYVLALYNRGALLNKLGRFREALTDFETVAKIQPDSPQVWSDRSIALAFLGRFDDALSSCEQALCIAPEFGQALANRGVVLNYLGRFDAALADFDRAQARLGETVEVLNGRALALRGMGRLDAALACHDDSIAAHPRSVQSHIDRSVTLAELGQIEQARRSYHAALALDLDCPDAHFNRGLLELGQGNLEAGWRGYEYRWARRGAEPRVFKDIPAWNGETLGSEQSLLVWSEQGLGDEILFASMLTDLKALGRRCVVECRAKLVELFRRSFPWATFLPRDVELPPDLRSSIAYQIPAGSLGRFFRRRIEDFPRHGGFLIANPIRVSTWRKRLDELGQGCKIGFSWRSSNLMGDRGLSCTKLVEWGSLLSTPGVQWICLQYDDCLAEIETARAHCGVDLHRFSDVDHYEDLEQVGALMKALDIVITAPTSVSMQSAAHGVPTWHMSYGPEWQMHGTQGFPWLPAIRRFERKWDESWQPVFDKVAQELSDFVATWRRG